MKNIYISILFFSLLNLPLENIRAQQIKNMDRINPYLETMNLEFYIPVENTIKIRKPHTNQFFNYDARIVTNSRDLEVLVNFLPSSEGPLSALHPHIEFNRLLGNLIPNEYEQEVLVVGWDDKKLGTKNADWGAEAYMKAREEITHLPFAKLIAFFKEDSGMVIMLYCFNKPDHIPELLSFKENL